jgi:transcription elongation factor GreA
MTQTQPAWLSRDAYARLKAELADLVRQREGALTEGRVPGAGEDRPTEPPGLDQRIRKLREMLRNPVVGAEPPDDGVAEPGTVLTIRYADDPDTETFLLAEREEQAFPDIEICSPDSPLGSAVVGVKEGQRCRYALPSGQLMTATLVRAVPYASYADACPPRGPR